MKNYFILYIFFFVLLLGGCKGCKTKKKVTIDLSAISVNLEIHRTELALYNAWVEIVLQSSTSSYNKIIDSLFISKNKDFVQSFIYGSDSLSEGASDDLLAFISDRNVRELMDTVRVVYPESYDFRKIFEDQMKRMKYYFPDFNVPVIYTFVSGFNEQDDIFIDENILGLGLHYFLGGDYKYYSVYPAFLRRYFTPSNLPVVAMKQLIYYQITDTTKKKEKPRFLDDIIISGKVLFVMDKIFPQVDDSMKIGYSTRQMAWAKENEALVWKDMIPMLYSMNYFDYHNYVTKLPFNPSYSNDSPGELGYFIGWQIVRKYADEHPGRSIKEIAEIKDAEIFLKESGYKP